MSEAGLDDDMNTSSELETTRTSLKFDIIPFQSLCNFQTSRHVYDK